MSVIQGKELQQFSKERWALSQSRCFKIDQRPAEKRAKNRERSHNRTAIRGNRILPFVGANRCPLAKRNRNGLLVSAEFRRQAAYQMDDHSSAAIGEFHVHPIRTGFYCPHKKLSEG